MGCRVVLLGSDEIALPAFRAVRALPGVEVVGVYSQPDRPAGRGQEVRPNPVAVWARSEALVLCQPESLHETDALALRSLQADLGVVMAYGQILKDDFLAATRLGFVNFHGSLLPALRGATPVEAALAEGLTETGVSLQQVVRRLDAGPLHAAARTSVAATEGRAALRARLGELAGVLAGSVLPDILAGRSVPVPQNEAHATYTRRLSRADAALDFHREARTIAQRVAALEGWPGSTFEHRGVVVKVGSASHEDEPVDPSIAPGTVHTADRRGVRIACGRGVVVFTRLQRPGGKMLPAGEFLSGHAMSPGDRLVSHPMPPLVSSAPFPRSSKA